MINGSARPRLWRPPNPSIIGPSDGIRRANFLPGHFPAGATAAGEQALATLTQVLSATDNSGAAFTLPVGVQAGDLIVVLDFASEFSGIPSSVTPSGFTNDIDVGGGIVRMMLSHKIADGSEGGASVNGMNGFIGEAKLTYVFRGNVPIASVSVFDTASEITNGNPTVQTVNASGAVVPLVVLGGYGSYGTVDPRTFAVSGSPVKDGEISASGFFSGPGSMYLAYKIYDASPADVSVDMDDEGDQNALCSCYIACS